MDKIIEATKILFQGGIVIFPTDTAYGIGCRMDNESSVKRLFELRRRPFTKAVPVLIDSIEMAEKYYDSSLSDIVRHLMSDYWPGALTIIYKCNTAKIPALVRASADTIGLRIPDHEIPLALISSIKVPLLGPSANFHGGKTPFTYKDLDKELMKKADYSLAGNCKLKQASTVVDCSVTPRKILRQGKIKVDFNKYL